MAFTRIAMRRASIARVARAISKSRVSIGLARDRDRRVERRSIDGDDRTFGHAILTRDSDTRIAARRVAARRARDVEARVRGVDARDDVGVARDVERECARGEAPRARRLEGSFARRARSDDGVDATEARRRRRGAARASRTDDDGTTKARARGRGRG